MALVRESVSWIRRPELVLPRARQVSDTHGAAGRALGRYTQTRGDQVCFPICMGRLWCAGFSSSSDYLCITHRLLRINLVEHGWGSDEYHPISKKGSNLTAAGGIGYTIVDTIDTLQLMGLDEEVARARTWVADSLTFERDAEYNTFEVRSQSRFHPPQYPTHH